MLETVLTIRPEAASSISFTVATIGTCTLIKARSDNTALENAVFTILICTTSAWIAHVVACPVSIESASISLPVEVEPVCGMTDGPSGKLYWTLRSIMLIPVEHGRDYSRSGVVLTAPHGVLELLVYGWSIVGSVRRSVLAQVLNLSKIEIGPGQCGRGSLSAMLRSLG